MTIAIAAVGIVAFFAVYYYVMWRLSVWLMLREDRLDRERDRARVGRGGQALERCPRCEIVAPRWFIEEQADSRRVFERLCGFCLRKAYRRPRLDEKHDAYWAEYAETARKYSEASKKPRVYAKVIEGGD